ncbi:hypothetical protein LNP74_28680 [Klebsiella pneumoniae subsp. pneumoniae]|nr:hypothetical protein [Klebsiella pneumoniae subsp. pneumoniae]
MLECRIAAITTPMACARADGRVLRRQSGTGYRRAARQPRLSGAVRRMSQRGTSGHRRWLLAVPGISAIGEMLRN